MGQEAWRLAMAASSRVLAFRPPRRCHPREAQCPVMLTPEEPGIHLRTSHDCLHAHLRPSNTYSLVSSPSTSIHIEAASLCQRVFVGPFFPVIMYATTQIYFCYSEKKKKRDTESQGNDHNSHMQRALLHSLARRSSSAVHSFRV